MNQITEEGELLDHLQAIRSALTPGCANTSRTASAVARHQSRGSCSAQPVWGDAHGACSAVADQSRCLAHQRPRRECRPCQHLCPAVPCYFVPITSSLAV